MGVTTRQRGSEILEKKYLEIFFEKRFIRIFDPLFWRGAGGIWGGKEGGDPLIQLIDQITKYLLTKLSTLLGIVIHRVCYAF
jgi:hypothetical protein